MTLTCPTCGSVDIELTSDNGAKYPQTRVEFYTCRECGETFRKVLSDEFPLWVDFERDGVYSGAVMVAPRKRSDGP